MGKMIKCKTCGEEIAKSARVCPKCGAKQKRHTILGIVLIVVGIFAIIGALSGNDNPTKVGETEKSQSSTTGADSEMQTEFYVGEKVDLNNVVATLVNVSESSGSQFNKPTDGNVFLLCEFEIENNSTSDIVVSSILSFEAYVDGYSKNMSLSAVIESDKPQLDGTVAATKKINGVVGYEVPSDWQEIEIHYTPNFWGGKDITFIATK
ncbi:DUF4352 domain-containing protein [Dysosmobacter sp.]